MKDLQVARIAKALADPRRFAILQAVAAADGELACKRLVTGFPVSQATISHHLKELATAGLIPPCLWEPVHGARRSRIVR